VLPDGCHLLKSAKWCYKKLINPAKNLVTKFQQKLVKFCYFWGV